MARSGLLGLRISTEFGGQGLSDIEFRLAQEKIAAASGALAFLQTQHQSGCNFVQSSSNSILKAELLQNLATGVQRIGIAFSQLRKPESPPLTATICENGYRLNGTAPWITGYGIFDSICIAAVLPDGSSVWGVIPFTNSKSFQVSEVMELAALSVVQTVSAQITDLLLPNERVLFNRPVGWIHENDALTVALQAPFALGCAQAAINVMKQVNLRRKMQAINHAVAELSNELKRCRQEAYEAMSSKENRERSIEARAWAIELMGRASHAAVICSAGAGNSIHHSAQRVYREAIVFSVSAQTAPILESSLKRLLKY